MGLPRRLWDQLSPWLQRVTLSATEKALPHLLHEGLCDVPVYENGQHVGPCINQPVLKCDMCGRKCCLDHCRIDQYWDGVCYACLMEFAATKRVQEVPPPGPRPWERAAEQPTPEQQQRAERAAVRAAHRMIGVRIDASDAEVKAALKQKLASCHPDRVQSERAKLKAEERFKQLQDAYRVIMKSRGQAAA